MSAATAAGPPPPGPAPRKVAAALELTGLTKSFGALTVVDHVSVTVPVGGRLAVIGPNGAGKTTLFRMIAGELPVSSGSVALFGDDVTRVSERGRAIRGVSRTFQVSNLFPSLSAVDNVRLAAQVNTATARTFWRRTAPDDTYGDHAREALEQVGLGGRASDSVSDLSHGEQRQLEIAMALVSRPRLLLFDEPAAGLSQSERMMLQSLLQQLPADLSYVLIEHDMSLALELTDQVLCLDNGRPLAYGSPAEIRADAQVQAVYLGRRP
ncbi:ABC transporter ATP-binding protein [Ruania zhangjianzhongii]|uniref:ABC transporter ATP-binding protein n=1 Tax=Ruania zhangjianzhongii TaxID=2603206 RepID=UPI0011CAB67C|nr:ABC transporter ATP-binding protein [Ruania zhangjianzhongii]